MGALIPITDCAENARAFEALKDAFTSGAISYPDHAVGWQGGSVRLEVHWRRDLRIWGVLERFPPRAKNPGRFWNLFGVTDPSLPGSVSIAVELNPPHEGKNGRLAGVFLRDDQGRIYIGHTGRVGGGRPGIGQRAFRQYASDWDWKEIAQPRRKRRTMVVFGPFDGADWLSKLASYVHVTARFKSQASDGMS